MATTWEFVDNPPFELINRPSLSTKQLAVWQLLQQTLPVDSILTGAIFARTLFGVFYDAGVGFPVRMNVTDFGKVEGGMQFPEDYPSLNEKISGRLSVFDEHCHQLVVVGIWPKIYAKKAIGL